VVSKTRVCIKNFPPRTTEQDLKEFLLHQQTGQSSNRNGDGVPLRLQITDCKILKNAKGKSRKVAFVGFRQPEQARHAIETFHRTYLNMSRITVEAATAKTDEASRNEEAGAKPRSGDFKAGKLENDATASTKDDDKKATNSKVKEFLSLMGAGDSKSKFWSNDAAAGEDEEAVETDPKSNSDDSDSENDSDSDDSSSSSDDDDDDTAAKAGDKTKSKSALSDMDFLRSKTKQVDDLDADGSDSDSDTSSSSSSSSSSSDSDSDGEDLEQDKLSTEKPKDRQEARKEAPGEHGNTSGDDMNVDDDEDDDDAKQLAMATGASKTRLFVRNLAFETTEEELQDYFSPFGKVTECHIPIDDQKRNKGYGFVTFESAVDAMEATNQLDKVDFQGRLLHILQARPPPQAASSANANDKNLTWKQKQELARKEKDTKGATGEASQGWSASFVRGDAVVDNLAERLGLRKGDILGVKDKLSSGDAAVRLALGETQIIEENREYFRQHGVDMEALVSANEPSGGGDSSSATSTKKRSKTAILVKNLPFDTRVEELEKLFHVGQEPVKILLPPSRTIAMIEYGHSTDAKRAFRKLAYRRFKHVPIYLEWAPLHAKRGASVGATHSESESSMKAGASEGSAAPEDAANSSGKSTANDDADEVDGDDVASSTLYVKNLNFETTEESLQKLFEKQLGRNVLSVRIPRKVNPIKGGSSAASDQRTLSMGYGFVELASHELARKALKTLQGKLVDGYALQLAISAQKAPSRTKPRAAPTGAKAPTKLMVRNVPFQATRTEILKLFGSFGQLKKVRLPKKFDGSHRGFAFVEYLTGKEALAAMNALSRTHLYGRHLVLEWASVDEETNSGKHMEKLREKAKRDAAGAAVASAEQKRKNKKIRFD